MKNYYQILGLLETASPVDIHRAYRQMALDWHPDRHVGESQERIAVATARFQEIGEAFGVLSDPSRKADYDWMLRRSRTTPPQPSRQSTSASAAARPYAGRPSSHGRQSSARSGSRGTKSRADSSYSRARNWGASNTECHYAEESTYNPTFGDRVFDFLIDVLQAVWGVFFACATVISCAIKIRLCRMTARRQSQKQTCNA